MQAKFYPVNGDLEILEENKDGLRFHIHGENYEYDGLQTSLLGRFQAENAYLALRVAEVLNSLGWGISNKAMRIGIKNARWPGRMQVLGENPLVVADGAHNSQAAAFLMEDIRRFFDFRRLFLIFGCMRDKNILELLDSFLPPAARVIITRSKNDRAEEPEAIKNLIEPTYLGKTIVVPDTRQAVQRALDEAETEDMVLITGSLYVVGEILPLFYPDYS
jgi:dihydrofolate synthase/folylpolyglutamate synthase